MSTSGNTVTLTFPTSQYTNLQEIAGTAILPKSVWSKVGNPATYTDANPVGTGPYMLGTFTPQGFTLKKNPYYWQASRVQVPNVYFPVYTSNTGALQRAVLRGDRLDRELHPRPAEELRRHQPVRPPLTGRRPAAPTASCRT